MADSRETAKAIYESDKTGELFCDAEDALATAERAGDEPAQEFWRSMFREFCNLVGNERFGNDVAWQLYEAADGHANGVSPDTGPAGEKETPCL